MKKNISIFTLLLLCVFFKTQQLEAQQVVFHKDLNERLAENTAVKQLQLSTYNTAMDSIKSYKQKVAADWAIITTVQQKIYNALTNVDDGIKQAKQMKAITDKIPVIFDNILTASELAIGKPYLVVYWNTTGGVLISKVADLSTYITSFIMSHDDQQMLINQTTRDELLWSVYNKINIIYNISDNMVTLFKMYTLQTAINKIVPISFYKDLDESIVTRVLNQAKQLP